VYDEKTTEQTELLAGGYFKVAVHANDDTCPDHLSETKLGRSDTSSLTEEVEPSDDPSRTVKSASLHRATAKQRYLHSTVLARHKDG
jgi:hypothetical protein